MTSQALLEKAHRNFKKGDYADAASAYRAALEQKLLWSNGMIFWQKLNIPDCDGTYNWLHHSPTIH
jgi:hypothetical protein